MEILMVVIFVLGYLAIAMEHPLKIDKAATAMVTGVLCWTIYIVSGPTIVDPANVPDGDFYHYIVHDHHHKAGLLYHLSEIASILFFLLGAMTVVELIDAYEGFAVVTKRIKTTKKVTLMWTLCIVAFFFSAVLDNLTTAIVMAALLKKLIRNRRVMWLFAGMIIISANAGGAWSPIGDVTTIMLWIGGQVTAMNIIVGVFTPSLVCMLVPLIILTFRLKGDVMRPMEPENKEEHLHVKIEDWERNLVFSLGVGALLFVPLFKTLTHLPPFMGILMGLGFLWMVTAVLNRNKPKYSLNETTVEGVLTKIDTPSVLFFLGILLAVASLQSAGQLGQLAVWLDETVGNIYVINIVIGVLSSIVDNVPLVAAASGMYPIAATGDFAQDGAFWEFLAYCAGTGGSCLIIGSAAGVAIMGILKIDFLWYIKKISLLALVGYLCGAATYLLIN
ncbi:sodium:proton antiporter NhaD [bacterium SCSIO 12741]|nr:sodium:proton antiporter NhaD [bacterium SCSIO 12741]